MVERIGDIEKRLDKVEYTQKGINGKVDKLTEEVKEVNGKLEEEFKELLKNDKQNQSLIEELREQNVMILMKILEGNDKADNRNHELRMLKWTEIMKILGVMVGAGGIIYIIVMSILN